MLSDTSRTAASTLAVAAGGAVGAACRYELWRLWPDSDAGFPVTTFFINIAGCFLFGICAYAFPEIDSGERAVVRSFLMFGVLGGFTTFSFFAIQGVTLTSPRLGVLYLALTPVTAVGAVWAGRLSAMMMIGSSTRGRHAR